MPLLSSVSSEGPHRVGRHPPYGGPVLEQRQAGVTVRGGVCAHGPRRPAPGVQRAGRREHRQDRGSGARRGVPGQRLRHAEQQEERARHRPRGHQ